MAPQASPKVINSTLVLLGVFLISLNLRGPISGTGPLLETMREQLSLSMTQAGLLTTLILLAFAVFSPVASYLGRRRGLEEALMLSICLIFIGIITRSMGTVSTLMGGTIVIGAGIAIANVLLPSLIKRDFPDKIATITAIYVLMMGIGSTLSASLAVPVLHLADKIEISFVPNWAFSLGIIVIFPLLAMLVWVTQLGKSTAPSADVATINSHSPIWRSAGAWQITTFLSLNSTIMYIFVCWLPTILLDHGFSETEAGNVHGVLQFFTMVPALFLIPLMKKIQDKRIISLVLTLFALVSIIGLLVKPSWALTWAMFFGFGGGGGFILGLSFISIRTASPQQAASLSGMAQCLGYLLAALGPIFIGLLHEYTGNWQVPLWVCAACCIGWSIVSVFASQPHLITKKLVQNVKPSLI